MPKSNTAEEGNLLPKEKSLPSKERLNYGRKSFAGAINEEEIGSCCSILGKSRINGELDDMISIFIQACWRDLESQINPSSSRRESTVQEKIKKKWHDFGHCYWVEKIL